MIQLMAIPLYHNSTKWNIIRNLRNLINGARYERHFCSETHQGSGKNESGPSVGETNHQEERSEVVKRKILSAALPFVHTHGWSKTSLSEGAESIGYPGVIHGLFPKGGVELVEYFYHISNEAQVICLLSLSKEHQNEISLKNPSKKVILGGVEARLRLIIPYKDRWPEALALMSLPPNIPIALANLLTIVDDICYYAGDRSVDMVWYSRRIALAGIYKTTELYMLSDSSPDHVKTWDFLNRRINDAIQLELMIRSSETAGALAKDIAASTFTTARNILGLNWNR